jgi:hypothetical protein
VVKDLNALDLNELLQHELGEKGLRPILDLVAQHSWWVSPKVYRGIQVVYPKTRRKKGISEKRGQVVTGIRLWDNQPASRAFWMALGQDPTKVRNFFVCHIYEGSVWDSKHFTNLANLTAFPSSLQSLSEWPPVRDLLKYHSFVIFGYTGPSDKEPRKTNYYPTAWRHQLDPDPVEVQIIVRRLKEQASKRPEFKTAQEVLAT